MQNDYVAVACPYNNNIRCRSGMRLVRSDIRRCAVPQTYRTAGACPSNSCLCMCLYIFRLHLTHRWICVLFVGLHCLRCSHLLHKNCGERYVLNCVAFIIFNAKRVLGLKRKSPYNTQCSYSSFRVKYSRWE